MRPSQIHFPDLNEKVGKMLLAGMFATSSYLIKTSFTKFDKKTEKKADDILQFVIDNMMNSVSYFFQIWTVYFYFVNFGQNVQWKDWFVFEWISIIILLFIASGILVSGLYFIILIVRNSQMIKIKKHLSLSAIKENSKIGTLRSKIVKISIIKRSIDNFINICYILFLFFVCGPGMVKSLKQLNKPNLATPNKPAHHLFGVKEELKITEPRNELENEPEKELENELEKEPEKEPEKELEKQKIPLNKLKNILRNEIDEKQKIINRLKKMKNLKAHKTRGIKKTIKTKQILI